jgi:hypothetical protein
MTDAHEFRVGHLQVLSDLIGCHEKIGGQLPDGRRPDVMRIDKRRKLLVVGDAKASESPNNLATLARLLAYLRWIEAHVARKERVGVFALCCRQGARTICWQRSITLIASELDLKPISIRVAALTSSDAVVCCVFAHPALLRSFSRENSV